MPASPATMTTPGAKKKRAADVSVLEVMHANVDKAQRLLRSVVPQWSGSPRPCHCGE